MAPVLAGQFCLTWAKPISLDLFTNHNSSQDTHSNSFLLGGPVSLGLTYVTLELFSKLILSSQDTHTIHRGNCFRWEVLYHLSCSSS